MVAGLANAAGSLPVEPTGGLWGRLTGAEPVVTDDPRGSLLDDRLGHPLRDLLWRRALLGATVVHAAVGAVQLDDRISLLEGDMVGDSEEAESPEEEPETLPDAAGEGVSPAPER